MAVNIENTFFTYYKTVQLRNCLAKKYLRYVRKNRKTYAAGVA